MQHILGPHHTAWGCAKRCKAPPSQFENSVQANRYSSRRKLVSKRLPEGKRKLIRAQGFTDTIEHAALKNEEVKKYFLSKISGQIFSRGPAASLWPGPIF